MAKAKAAASFDDGSVRINLQVNLLIWVEDGIHFMYAPSLDLTGYGESESVAEASFKVTLREFVEYTKNKRTLFEELERLGWLVNKRKKRVHAPNHAELLSDNETYRELSERSGVRSGQTELALAL
jgi:hypothetical protein